MLALSRSFFVLFYKDFMPMALPVTFATPHFGASPGKYQNRSACVEQVVVKNSCACVRSRAI
jgi:hypothetical protein